MIDCPCYGSSRERSHFTGSAENGSLHNQSAPHHGGRQHHSARNCPLVYDSSISSIDHRTPRRDGAISRRKQKSPTGCLRGQKIDRGVRARPPGGHRNKSEIVARSRLISRSCAPGRCVAWRVRRGRRGRVLGRAR